MRVWPRLHESARSASDLLGHKRSDIYRHSPLNRHRPIPDIIESLERSGGMAGTCGMRAVPLGPSCDLVVAGKAGMDGLWLAALIFKSLTGKGLRNFIRQFKHV